MVCIVQALGNDTLVEDENELLHVINRAIGKSWSRLSKQGRHNTTNNHKSGHFCTSKTKVAKDLQLWLHGLVRIGGQYRTASGVWTADKLRNWVTKYRNHGVDEKEKKSVEKTVSLSLKRPLADILQRSSKKKQISNPKHMNANPLLDYIPCCLDLRHC